MSQMTQILKMPKLNCWPKKFLQALHDLNHVDLHYGDHDDHDYGDLDWGDRGDHGRNVYCHFWQLINILTNHFLTAIQLYKQIIFDSYSYLSKLGCTGLYRARTSCARLYWALLSCTRLCWAVLGCFVLSGLWRALLGCTGLNWADLGCSGMW